MSNSIAPVTISIMLGLAATSSGPERQRHKTASDATPTKGDNRLPDAPIGPVSIPFELRDNLVTLPSAINGQPKLAVLDSGAGGLIIDQKTTADLGLTEAASIGDVAGAGAEAQQLRPIILSSLVVGPLTMKKTAAYSVNLEQLSSSAGFPINLLIGSPAFKAAAITIDYRHSLVTFGPSGSAKQCASPIPLTILNDVPVVTVNVRPTRNTPPVALKLVVDLGTRHRAAIFGGRFVRTQAGQALIRSSVSRQVGHGTGGEIEGNIVRIAELRIGGSRIENLEVALTTQAGAFEQGSIDGSLGVPFWKAGSITFDYQARKLCIER